jgi:hypothetical protein
VGKTCGNHPLGRTGRKWVNSIEMDHREIGCKDSGWIELAQGFFPVAGFGISGAEFSGSYTPVFLIISTFEFNHLVF